MTENWNQLIRRCQEARAEHERALDAKLEAERALQRASDANAAAAEALWRAVFAHQVQAPPAEG